MKRLFSCSRPGSLIHLFQKLIDRASIVRYPKEKLTFKILRKSNKKSSISQLHFFCFSPFCPIPCENVIQFLEDHFWPYPWKDPNNPIPKNQISKSCVEPTALIQIPPANSLWISRRCSGDLQISTFFPPVISCRKTLHVQIQGSTWKNYYTTRLSTPNHLACALADRIVVRTPTFEWSSWYYKVLRSTRSMV